MHLQSLCNCKCQMSWEAKQDFRKLFQKPGTESTIWTSRWAEQRDSQRETLVIKVDYQEKQSAFMQSKYRQWNLSQLKARWVPKKWQRSRKSPRNCHHRGEPTGWRRKREEIEETSDLHWSLCIPNIPCIMDGQHTPAERDWYTEHLSVMKTEIRLNQQSDNSFLNENDLHFCPLHITRSRIHLGSKPEPQRSNLKGKKMDGRGQNNS